MLIIFFYFQSNSYFIVFSYFSGEYGRIYKGELIDSGHKCIIKTLQSDYATQNVREEYGREIESMNIYCD